VSNGSYSCLPCRKIDAAFGGLDVRLPLDKESWQHSAHEWSSPSDGKFTSFSR